MFNVIEARNNVRRFKKDFGTSNIEIISRYIKQLSIDGYTQLELSTLSKLNNISGINKKDYYILKRNGYDIKFTATYNKKQINQYCTEIKTRDITLQEYFSNDASLEDRVVIISWEG